MSRIILASASPRRKELLTQMGVEFTVYTSNIEEKVTESDPEAVVKELSMQKSRDVYDRLDECDDIIVIGADTIVYAEDRILGKPKDEDDCRQMLRLLQGRTHHVYTGVTIITREQEISFAEDTLVKVHEMDDVEIDEYIRTGEPMDKAGGYGIQGYFAKYVEGIDGDYNNVVGLPIARLYQEMKKINNI